MSSPNRSMSGTAIVLGAAVGLLVLVSLLPGDREPAADGSELTVLCTFLPVHVLTLNVVGDAPGVNVQLLVPPNVGCPHSYAMRSGDLKRVGRAGVIVANGLGIEGFLDEAIRQNASGRLITISDGCDVLYTRCEHATHHPDDERGDDGGAGDAHNHEHGDENPHVWVSPLQAIRQVRSLARQLADADPQRAELYEANGEAYVLRLQALHKDMRTAADAFGNRRIVTFHDAFAYLARDLGLDVVATLTVDPGHQISATKMAEVIRTIRRTGAAAVFCEPAYSDAAARSVADEAGGIPVLMLNPLNTIDGEPTAESYEQVMRQNLEVLEKALASAP